LKERRNLGPSGMLGGPGRLDAALVRRNDGDSEGRLGDNRDIASSSQEVVSFTRRTASSGESQGRPMASVSIEGNRWARSPELFVAATDLEGRWEVPGNLGGGEIGRTGLHVAATLVQSEV
jgi:hypothetical protein